MRPAGPAWLASLEVTSPDVTVLTCFLGAVLDLEWHDEGAEGWRAAFLGELRLVVAAGPVPTGSRPVLAVEDVATAGERVRAAGGTVLAGPRKDVDGSWVEVQAPDGSRWNFRALSELALKERRARRHRLGVIPDLGLDWDGARRP